MFNKYIYMYIYTHAYMHTCIYHNHCQVNPCAASPGGAGSEAAAVSAGSSDDGMGGSGTVPIRGKVEGPTPRSGRWYCSRRAAGLTGFPGGLARLSEDPRWTGVGQSKMLVTWVSSESPPKPQIRVDPHYKFCTSLSSARYRSEWT